MNDKASPLKLDDRIKEKTKQTATYAKNHRKHLSG
jgi:hypothetical protein